MNKLTYNTPTARDVKVAFTALGHDVTGARTFNDSRTYARRIKLQTTVAPSRDGLDNVSELLTKMFPTYTFNVSEHVNDGIASRYNYTAVQCLLTK